MRAHRPIPVQRLALLLAALALAVAAILAWAPPARAGSYVAVQCHPEHDTTAADALFSRTSDHYLPASACPGAGAGLQIHNDAAVTKDGRYGAWSWYPPAGTEFAHVTSEVNVSHDAGHKGFVTIIDSAGNVHWRWPAEGGWQPVEWSAGSAAVAYTAWQQCYAGAAGSCGGSGAAHTSVRRLWFTLSDRADPTLALAGGLFEAGPRRGPQTALLSSTDVGGGVWRWRLLVNGVAAASADAGCDIVPGGPARRFVPCPLSAAHAFELNTEAPPFHDGANSVTACASDVGWPANEVCASRQVSVDNSCPSSGPAAAAGIEAAFANGRGVATTASNRRAAIRGRLSGAGTDLSGAGVCVYSRVGGGEERLEGSARVEGGGRFAYSVPRGPSRAIRVAFRHRSSLVERLLALRVRVRPRLKVGPRSRLGNGEVARFRGKLPGPGAAGRVVVLQARVGGRWQAFKSARSGPEGRFRARYRFRETTGRRLYRFRAVVREQAGYPYLKGASPVRRVLVSG